MKKKQDEIIYYITASDLQNVAEEQLERELTPAEIKIIANRVGDYLPWYDAIAFAIGELILKEDNGNDHLLDVFD